MLVILLALLLSATPAFADPGDLDPSFGDGGVARVAIGGGGFGAAMGAVVQADGKVVTVGRSDRGDFAIVRFRADGTLDPGFSGDGRFTLSFGGEDSASAVTQQPDGKLVVAGYSGCRPVVVRLTTAGEVDPTFAFDGSVGPCAEARLLTLQDDGKVLVAGREGLGTWVVRRLSASGAPDFAFGSGGVASSYVGLYAWANGIAVDGTGRVLLAGDDGSRPAVLRFAADGRRDESFGVSGVWSPLSNWNADARSVAPGPNGTVLVGVQFTDGQSANAMLRLTDSGALDVTYSGDGLATLHSGAVPDKLVPSADGRVLFADSDHVGRVSASGAVDFITRVFTPTWGREALALTGGGRVVRAADGGLGFRAATVSAAGAVSNVATAPSPVLDGATMVPRKVLPVGGGIVIVGTGGSTGTAGGESVALASVSDDGTPRWSRVDVDRGRLYGAAAGPDGSIAVVTAGSLVRYSGEGERLVSVALDFPASAVAVQPDGSVLVAGTEFRPAETQLALWVVRYTADGALDRTFAGDGRFEHLAPIPFGAWFVANGLTVQADGKVVIAGALDDMIVIRLTPHGELDPTFSGDGIANGLGWSARERLSNAWNVEALAGGLFLDTPSYPVHLLDDGALDRSFVSDVFATVNGRPGADGRLVVARKVPNTDRARLQRLDPDGALDPQFGVREFALGELVVTAPASDGATLLASAEDGDLIVRRLLGGGAIPSARAVLREFSYTTVAEGDEGEQVVPVTFDLAQAWPQDVTFRLTPGGTARRGEDYRLGADVLTIPAGQTRATVPVTVLGDTADEGDETIRLTATAVTPNLRVLAYSGTSQVQITDDAGDDGPAPTPTPDPTPEPTVTPDPTVTPAPTVTASPGATATATATATASPGPTATASPGPTATATTTASASPGPRATATPLPGVATPTPTASPRPDYAAALKALRLPRLTARGGAVTFTVKPVGTTLTVTLRSRGRKPVVYGRGSGTRRITVRLNAAGRKAARRTLKVDVVLSAGGARRTVAATIRAR